MYHLLTRSHTPRFSQGGCSSSKEKRELPPREPELEMRAIEEPEPPTEREGETTEEPEDQEPVYTVTGEPVLPEETEATTIVLDTCPTSIHFLFVVYGQAGQLQDKVTAIQS